jgi:Glutamate-1-semialdehyde aminotransferase
MTGSSAELFARAQKRVPGGVNSPVRAFRGVGGEPFFVDRAQGSRIWTIDGRELIDYVGSWGPAILGHANPKIVSTLCDAAQRGVSFGIPNPLEVEMAELICTWMPAIEKVRMVNSGTEATMSCLRLARGFTKRDKIIKFAGCYHGHADSLLVKAGSGALTHGQPDSAGVPKAIADETIVLPFNDIDAVRTTFRENKDQIACVILEPIPANAGLFFPREDFLHQLRVESAKNGALLIFDEVMTGFRVARGGAQHVYGIRPDLTTLGKVIGGGRAGRRLWGPRGDHGFSLARWTSLPSGNAVRKSAGNGSGAGYNCASSNASMAGNYSSNSEHNWKSESAMPS